MSPAARALSLAAVLALAAAFMVVRAWREAEPAAEPAIPSTLAHSAAPAAGAGPGASPAAATPEDVEVFQRAFWRRPAPADRILHAERREWAGEDGVKRWAWFIVVEPGPDLLAHLRERDPFQLRPGPAPVLENAPAWFQPPAGARPFSRGALHLFFAPGDHLLHATASGTGFTPPVRR